MLKKTNNSGISLVVLVVTIIVLIILTGAVIVTFMDGGIIDRANESVFKNDIRSYQEQLVIMRAKEQMAISTKDSNYEGPKVIGESIDELDEIKEILPEFKDEYKDLVIINDGELVLGTREEEPYKEWLEELGIGKVKSMLANVVEIGDYVAYEPDEVSKVELDGEILGNGNDKTSIWQESINWRVLSKNGNKVILISEGPVNNISFGAEEMYSNGPTTIDSTMKTLYSKTGVGEARNLNLDDIIDIMGINQADIIELNNSGAISLGKYVTEDPLNEKNILDQMIGSDETWLSSAYVSEQGKKGMYVTYMEGITGIFHMTKFQNSAPYTAYMRPIVVLNSDISITDEQAETVKNGEQIGKTSSTAWKIK